MAYEPPVQVQGTMQTPDGRWRVEACRRRSSYWYRIVRGDDVIDWLTIGEVQRILAQAGIDLADLTEAEPAA